MFFPFRNHTYRFLDVHTHQAQLPEKVLAIKNIFAYELKPKFQLPENRFYSIGLHPWHIQDGDVKREMKALEDFAQHPLVLAIGEAGLDRCINTDWRTQSNILFKHAEIAETYQKPLIIHCVRAYSEIIALKKQFRPKSAWILHGYQANAAITEQLIRNQFILSFGEILLKEKSLIHQLFTQIPDNQIFIETDASETSIEQIFQKAAELKEISEEKLQEILFANFKRCFWGE